MWYPVTNETSISRLNSLVVLFFVISFIPSLTSSEIVNIQRININKSIPTLSSNIIDKINLTPCRYGFKVFVYPLILPSLKISEAARTNKTLHVCAKCILEQFSLEYIIYDFFTQFCGRTTNPDEADYFYLPIIRDAEYRVSLMKHDGHGRRPSSTESAILDILEKKDFTQWSLLTNYTDKYWKRSNGFDHILVMPAPVTNFRHESGTRGFFHYMPHLHAPIFLGVEYSKSFINEYPICSMKKNIVVPYPVTDPKVYNGYYFNHYSVIKSHTNKYDVYQHHNISYEKNKYIKANITRSALLFYSGGMHGECVHVRRALKEIMNNASGVASTAAVRSTKTKTSANKHSKPKRHSKKQKQKPNQRNLLSKNNDRDVIYRHYHINIVTPTPTSSIQQIRHGNKIQSISSSSQSQSYTREYHFLNSIFCAIPIGDSPSSKRMYDVMNYGCVPVVLSDDLIWAFAASHNMDIQSEQIGTVRDSASASASDGGHQLDPRQFSIQLPQCVVQFTLDVLIRRYKSRPHLFGYLPYTNTSIYHILESIYISNNNASSVYIGDYYLNPLVLILLHIPIKDVLYLQGQVTHHASYYRYYKMNEAMDVIPTATHWFPDGGAVDLLSRSLAQRKAKGITHIGEACQLEKHRKNHKYIGHYPCEKNLNH